jgi:hypothetical protein
MRGTPILMRIRRWPLRVPLWLRIVGGIVLVVFACGALIYGILAAVWAAIWESETHFPCVDGGPGSSAIFRNGGTQLFVFPESATNIENDCYVWQGAIIQVWFEMDADELESFLDSMRWEVRPLVATSNPPNFGNPQDGATYLLGEYNEPPYPEGASVWIDTSNTPYCSLPSEL